MQTTLANTIKSRNIPMKLRIIASILIFISAYSPLSFVFLIQDFDFAVNKLKHPQAVFIMLGISLLSCLILSIAVRTVRSSNAPVKVKSSSIRSGELINYSIPYMISFFIMDLSNPNQYLSFGFFMLLMYWMTMKTHNIFINPILAIMGYGIYNVRYELDGKEFEDFFLVKGERLQTDQKYKIQRISECLYIVTERIPKVQT